MLHEIIRSVSPNTTVLLADGVYNINDSLRVIESGVTLRSESGRPESVVIDLNYNSNSVVIIRADDVTVANVTLTHGLTHGVQIQSSNIGVELLKPVIYNVHLIDNTQQAIKINDADDGLIACNHLELTNRSNCGGYSGGIRAYNTRGWHIHDNYIAGFWCEGQLADHGIHLERSADTLIERNLVVDCARGITLGFNENPPSEDYRRFDDITCPVEEMYYVDHYNGTVINNIVINTDLRIFQSITNMNTGREGGVDAAIALWNACNAKVFHNTIYRSQAAFSDIEVRFEGTYATIKNNLMTQLIHNRGAGNIEEAGNFEIGASDGEIFKNIPLHDFRLKATALCINTGVDLNDVVSVDINGQARSSSPDPGAYEFIP